MECPMRCWNKLGTESPLLGACGKCIIYIHDLQLPFSNSRILWVILYFAVTWKTRDSGYSWLQLIVKMNHLLSFSPTSLNHTNWCSGPHLVMTQWQPSAPLGCQTASIEWWKLCILGLVLDCKYLWNAKEGSTDLKTGIFFFLQQHLENSVNIRNALQCVII